MGAGMNLGATPLWLDFLLLFAMMAVAFEIGSRLFRQVRSTDPAEDNSDESYALSGVFGLLALMMAFSFSLALSRYDERRELVVAEANAIGTFASRVTLLDATDGEAVRRLLGQYAQERIAYGQARTAEASAAAYARSEALHGQIGTLIYASLGNRPPDTRGPLILPPYNEAGDIASQRRAAREARLPATVLGLLALYCLAGAAILGYNLGEVRARHRPAALVFFGLLAAAFITVLDLDRPRGGSILVPQTELEREAAKLTG